MAMDRSSLHAYMATLFAICYLVTVGLYVASQGRSVEAVGVAAAVTGLIGLIRFPNTKSVTVDNTAQNPIPTSPSEEAPDGK